MAEEEVDSSGEDTSEVSSSGRRKSFVRRHPIMLGIGIFVLLLLIVGGAILNSLTIDIARENLVGDLRREYKQLPSDHNLTYQNITLETEDGLELSAWWMPRNSSGDPDHANATIIIIHGYALDMHVPMKRWAPMLVNDGYNVLALDLRGHGASEVDASGMISYGDNEVMDAWAAVRYVKDNAVTLGLDPDRIVLYGGSMGATISMEAAIRMDDETRVAAIIEDSGFASFENQLYLDASKQGYPKFLGWIVFQQMKRLQDGFDLDAVNPVDEIGDLDIPHLMLHCENDERVEFENWEKLTAEGNDMMTSQSFDCPGSGDNHTQGHQMDDEYDPLVLSWLDTNV